MLRYFFLESLSKGLSREHQKSRITKWCEKHPRHTSTNHTSRPAGQPVSRGQNHPLKHYIWLMPTCQHYISLQLRILEQLPLYIPPPRSVGVIGSQFICRTQYNRPNNTGAGLLGEKESVIISSGICWQRGQSRPGFHWDVLARSDPSDKERSFTRAPKWMLLPQGPLCQSATFQPNHLHHKQPVMMCFELICCSVKHRHEWKFDSSMIKILHVAA